MVRSSAAGGCGEGSCIVVLRARATGRNLLQLGFQNSCWPIDEAAARHYADQLTTAQMGPGGGWIDEGFATFLTVDAAVRG